MAIRCKTTTGRIISGRTLREDQQDARPILDSSYERADRVTRMIVVTYMAPNKTLPELREWMIQGKLDALSDFSEACCMELRRSAPRVLGPVPRPSRPEWQTGGVLPEV
jgi:hypothetical protein